MASGLESSYIKALRIVKNEEKGGFCYQEHYTPFPSGVILEKVEDE